MSNGRLLKKFCELLECDTARIVRPANDKLFLIIGWKRSTKDDTGQWFKNGEPVDFEYTKETTVASGRNLEELITEAKKYKRICGMTWEQYFREKVTR